MTTQDNPEIKGVQEESYLDWRRHPVTKMYLQYLLDYREALRRDHVARWEAGGMNMEVEIEAKGRANTLAELSDLSFEVIADFYKEPEEEEK